MRKMDGDSMVLPSIGASQLQDSGFKSELCLHLALSIEFSLDVDQR